MADAGVVERFRAIAGCIGIGLALLMPGCGSSGQSDTSPPSVSVAASASPTSFTSPTSPALPAVIQGRTYRFTAADGWVALPSVGTWNISKLPTDATPGVQRVSSPVGTGEWIAIGEHRIRSTWTLADWTAELHSLGTTNYTTPCGKTQVSGARITVSGQPANIDSFKCPYYTTAVAVVTMVSKDHGFIITCDSSTATALEVRNSCQRMLKQFRLNP
jgi:hypothetical protein